MSFKNDLKQHIERLQDVQKLLDEKPGPMTELVAMSLITISDTMFKDPKNESLKVIEELVNVNQDN